MYGYGGAGEEGPHFQYVPEADVFVQDEEMVDVTAQDANDPNANVNNIPLDLEVPREPSLTGKD